MHGGGFGCARIRTLRVNMARSRSGMSQAQHSSVVDLIILHPSSYFGQEKHATCRMLTAACCHAAKDETWRRTDG